MDEASLKDRADAVTNLCYLAHSLTLQFLQGHNASFTVLERSGLPKVFTDEKKQCQTTVWNNLPPPLFLEIVYLAIFILIE